MLRSGLLMKVAFFQRNSGLTHKNNDPLHGEVQARGPLDALLSQSKLSRNKKIKLKVIYP